MVAVSSTIIPTLSQEVGGDGDPPGREQFQYPEPLQPDTSVALCDFYRPFNAQLVALLNRHPRRSSQGGAAAAADGYDDDDIDDDDDPPPTLVANSSSFHCSAPTAIALLPWWAGRSSVSKGCEGEGRHGRFVMSADEVGYRDGEDHIHNHGDRRGALCSADTKKNCSCIGGDIGNPI